MPPSDPPQALRTMVAMRAFDAVDRFAVLSKVIPGWTAELSEPGMSTGGGRRAIQHVTLSNEGRTVVVGSVDFGARRVELRAHARVREAFYERYGIAFMVPPPAYDKFLSAVGAFFKGQAFSVQFKSADQYTIPPDDPAASSGFPWLVLLVGLVVIAGLGVAAWYFLLRPPLVPHVPNVWLHPPGPTSWPTTALP